jgi:hypothetical protein
MLAYVFWHWRRFDVSVAEYEARQRAFHEALGAAPPDGFHHSLTHGISGAPWAAAESDAYEDWYLVDDSAALDRLNAAAISASRSVPHDAAAAAAAGGTAGLYTLRQGAPPRAPRVAHWLSKPNGMRYDELFALLAPLTSGESAGASLWMRFMTLGPTTEFCLLSAEPLPLPPQLASRRFELRPVWPTVDVASAHR